MRDTGRVMLLHSQAQLPCKPFTQVSAAKRPVSKAAAAPTTAKVQEQARETSPLDILVSDCRFLHEHTGVDLLTTLAPVRDAHDQVRRFLL